MGSKKNNDSNKAKRVRMTIEMKKELIAKHEKGARVCDLVHHYGMAKSTISSILKNKSIIKGANVAKGVTVLAVNRSPIIEQVEKQLLVWIKKNKLSGDNISKKIICEEAKRMFQDLKQKYPGSSGDVDEFKASWGWFDRFRKRCGIYSVVRHEKIASASEKFVGEFKKIVEKEGLTPHQVFNCVETGLFWKRMPKRTYISKEEKSLPGYLPMNDRLSLLLCANASGDFKIKPLLVYHSENPNVFQKNNVIKSRLCVMWRSNSKARLTRQFFTEWIYEVFAPSVKEYLQESNLPLKALLIIENTHSHPVGLEEDLLDECNFIKVRFFPPYTAPLLQPMNLQVISSFKKLYTKALFQRCYEVTSDTELNLRDFWKNHFNILHCLRMIDKAWREVSFMTLNLAWKNLWYDCVKDLEGFEEKDTVVDDIVSLGKSMGLDIDSDDVEELVKGHKKLLTTSELHQLHPEQREEFLEEIYLEEMDCVRETLSTNEIQELCYYWEKTQKMVEKWHPNIGLVHRTINFFNDNIMDHFRTILRNRQFNLIIQNN